MITFFLCSVNLQDNNVDDLEGNYISVEGQSRIAYIVCRIAQYASRTTQYENGARNSLSGDAS